MQTLLGVSRLWIEIGPIFRWSAQVVQWRREVVSVHSALLAAQVLSTIWVGRHHILVYSVLSLFFIFQKNWVKVPSLPCKPAQECASTVWREHVVTAVPTRPIFGGHTIKLCRLANNYQEWEILDTSLPPFPPVEWPCSLLVDTKRDQLIMTTSVSSTTCRSTGKVTRLNDQVWVLASGNRWNHLGSLIGPFCATTIVDNLLIAAGPRTTRVAALHLESREWISWPDLPLSYAEARLAFLSGELLCLGGQGNKQVVAIDPGRPREWKTHICSPLQTLNSGITAQQECLYVAGGRRSADVPCENTCQVFTEQNRWKHLARLPAPCAVPSLVVHRGCLFAIGGVVPDATFKFLNNVYRLPLQWSLFCPLELLRHIPIFRNANTWQKFLLCKLNF